MYFKTVFCMALALGALSASALEIRNPRCEYRVNPLGIDAAHPRLSWELSSDQRGMVQESYRILVASAPDLLNRNQGDLWDSGSGAERPVHSGSVCGQKTGIKDPLSLESAGKDDRWHSSGKCAGLLEYGDPRTS